MLYSKIEGAGNAKKLVIIHGFLGMSDNWKTLGTQFAANGFQVHMLDLRNHGRSFHSDEFSYDAMARDVLVYCNENNLNNIILLGHSMGGKVAMQLACENPNLVEKLIIADIGPKFYAPHHQLILKALNSVNFSRHSWSVASAATSPSQNRRRDRRTYQFDKSSIKRARARPAT